MRFYLDIPLVVGYVLMAIPACLGVLQISAARGGYVGLSVFTSDRTKGIRIGAGLTVTTLVVYAFFAPEVLTPGPAGTEVAAMFVVCALIALGITFVSADLRFRRQKNQYQQDGISVEFGTAQAVMYLPPYPSVLSSETITEVYPTVIMLPDPADFVTIPSGLISTFSDSGFAVLVLGTVSLKDDDVNRFRRSVLAQIATVLAQIAEYPQFDADRIAVVGIGLGAEFMLRILSADKTIKAGVAVCPAGVVLDPALDGAGLYWLREMPFSQTWRWQRQREAIRRTAATLTTEISRLSMLPVSVAVFHGKSGMLTTRSSRHFQDLETIVLPIEKHFTLLEEESAQQLLVDWCQNALTRTESGSSAAAAAARSSSGM